MHCFAVHAWKLLFIISPKCYSTLGITCDITKYAFGIGVMRLVEL